MIDIKIVRNQPELVRDSIQKRNLNIDLDAFLELDTKKLALQIEVDDLRAIKNAVSKEIPTMSHKDRPAKIAEMKTLGDKLTVLESEQKQIESAWQSAYWELPNFLDETAAI